MSEATCLPFAQRCNDFSLFELMQIKPAQVERTCNYDAPLGKVAEKQFWELVGEQND